MSAIALGIVSDEISLDFEEALEHGIQWGIKIYELRCLKTGRVPNVDPAEFQEVLDLAVKHRVVISALSPGIFKHPLSKKGELEAELSDILPRTINMAKQLGTSLIIVFGFQREKSESQYQEAVGLMRRAGAMAEREGMCLGIENEPGFLCDSGSNTAGFLKDVGCKTVGANWDPCNGYGTSERPFPEGYVGIKDFIVNVHVKDTKEGAFIQCVPVGEGAIDWKGQISALVSDQPVEHVTIETHCLPLIEKSKQNVDTLRQYLADIRRTEKFIS